jgi:hypothetical protein
MLNTLITATPASAATTAVVSACGLLERGNSVAPLNAVSHIMWGDSATRQDDLSLQHTGAGVVLNTLAVTSWAGVYEAVFGNRARGGSISTAILGGIATSALAYVTDYYIVPRRLTPGFEKQLSPLSMFAVYTTLALSLPLGSFWGRKLSVFRSVKPKSRDTRSSSSARSSIAKNAR